MLPCNQEKENQMARLVRPSWAIRCVQSGCKTLFEVAQLENGKQQEVVCPNCGAKRSASEKFCGKCGAKFE